MGKYTLKRGAPPYNVYFAYKNEQIKKTKYNKKQKRNNTDKQLIIYIFY